MIELPQNILDDLTKKCLRDLNNLQFNEFRSIEDIKKLNINRKYGIVYFIYTNDKESTVLRYIGKSRGKYFKTRLKTHLFEKNKGTQSKSSKIQGLSKNTKVLIRYLEFNPDALRNTVEELLIENFKEQGLDWNYN